MLFCFKRLLISEIIKIARELKQQSQRDPRLNTPGKVALYDNLGKDVNLALQVHQVVVANAKHNFRNVTPRKIKLLRAIENVLTGTSFSPETILNIVINQPEYGND